MQGIYRLGEGLLVSQLEPFFLELLVYNISGIKSVLYFVDLGLTSHALTMDHDVENESAL